MNKKNVQILLMLLGLLCLVLCWQFVYTPNREKAAQVRAENANLQNTVTELENLTARESEFVEETKRMAQECDTIIAKFPADCWLEDRIMYLYNMECTDGNDLAIPSITLGNPEEIAYSASTTYGEYELQDDGIQMYDIQSNISFTTTYGGWKNVMDYIYRMPGRKSVTSVSMSPTSEGFLTGSMAIDFYYLTGTNEEYRPINIPAVGLGKDNIFGVLEENGNAEE